MMRGELQVKRLGEIMLQKLKENAHKGWPDRNDVESLFDHLMSECMELHEAWIEYRSTGQPDHRFACSRDLAREAADVACYAMFIADLCDGLDRSKEGTDVREAGMFD